MANYSADFIMTHVSGDSVGVLTSEGASVPRRLKIYDLTFGSTSTPADAAISWVTQRCTAAGTGTAVVPQKLDMADSAATAEAAENLTIEPTYTSAEIVLNVGLNQRATFRWVAAPGGEIVTPATDEAGVGWLPTLSTGTPVLTITAHYSE